MYQPMNPKVKFPWLSKVKNTSTDGDVISSHLSSTPIPAKSATLSKTPALFNTALKALYSSPAATHLTKSSIISPPPNLHDTCTLEAVVHEVHPQASA
jgi:hypothetical protein